MKVKAFLIAALAAVVLNVSAATSQNDGVITVKVNKASKVLVERWIEGYKAVNPNVQIALVSGKNADADLTLVTRHQEGVNVTYVGRYALLPVTSTPSNSLIFLSRYCTVFVWMSMICAVLPVLMPASSTKVSRVSLGHCSPFIATVAARRMSPGS